MFRDPMSATSAPPRRSTILRAFVAAVVILLMLVAGHARLPSFRFPWSASPPKVTQDMVVTQIQDVAKLVSTELTLRDVVSFDQTRFGLHRRMLLVVTGKVLAGIDLKKSVRVQIDDRAKMISIELPRAEILGVEVVNTTTYDETSTPFFRFEPEDRDRMQEQIRKQLRATGEQSGLLTQADRSASLVLQSMFTRDGYTAKVTTRTELAPGRPPG
jgi:hypothetical protein